MKTITDNTIAGSTIHAFERAQNFKAFMDHFYPANHVKLTVVQGVGHSGPLMLGSPQGIRYQTAAANIAATAGVNGIILLKTYPTVSLFWYMKSR